MDPEVAYSSLVDPSLSLRDRCLAGDGLEEWLQHGGYMPLALRDFLAESLDVGTPYPDHARIWVAGYVRALDSVASHSPALTAE